MKKAALYSRVSTGRQEQEATIESQLAEVKEKIKNDGNILTQKHTFVDDGWSGGLLARPSLDRLRDAAKNNEFEVLYVYDRGRLARDFVYQEIIIMELKDLEIEFASLHDVDAKTPEQGVMQKMQGVFHEYERIKIAERFRRGKLFKTRNGKLLGYNPPYGYDYIYKTRDKNGEFVVNEKEADVIRKIFGWIGNEGYTINKVIKRLYELKIPPRKQKRPTWTNGPLSRILRDTTYIGQHYYNKTVSVVPIKPIKQEKYRKIKKCSRKIKPKDEWIEYKCPRIIDDELFYKTQEQLKINYQFCKRNKKNKYLLSSLIYCTCGRRRCGEGSAKNHLYYRCNDRVARFPLPKQCQEGGINARILDSLAWKEIKKLLLDKKRIKSYIVSWSKSQSEEPKIDTQEIEKLEKQLKQLDIEEERYLKALGLGASIEIFEKQIKELNSRRSIVKDDLSEKHNIFQSCQSSVKINVNDTLNKTLALVRQYNFSNQEELVRKLIDKVITSQQEATIIGHIPVESEYSYVKLPSISRNRRIAKCRQVDAIQRISKKPSGGS